MKIMTNYPVYPNCLDSFGSMEGLREACTRMGLDGLEIIWGDPTIPPPPFDQQLTVGYHLPFWHDWVDFWRGDQKRLLSKFGTREAIRSFYGSEDPQVLIRHYEREMERAASLGAEYVVFHVSDVSLEEGYTYQWQHSDREVIDASLEVINALAGRGPWPFAILVENQWWPGFTFTNPDLTAYLLEGIQHRNKGILLDTGHLLNTNPALRDEPQAIRYLHDMLNRHEQIVPMIRGIHLHQSLSGEYVRTNTGSLPPDLAQDYFQRFAQTYPHVLQIDRHEPWTHQGIGEVIRRIAPEWLTHELSAPFPQDREAAVLLQSRALGR